MSVDFRNARTQVDQSNRTTTDAVGDIDEWVNLQTTLEFTPDGLNTFVADSTYQTQTPGQILLVKPDISTPNLFGIFANPANAIPQPVVFQWLLQAYSPVSTTALLLDTGAAKTVGDLDAFSTLAENIVHPNTVTPVMRYLSPGRFQFPVDANLRGFTGLMSVELTGSLSVDTNPSIDVSWEIEKQDLTTPGWIPVATLSSEEYRAINSPSAVDYVSRTFGHTPGFEYRIRVNRAAGGGGDMTITASNLAIKFHMVPTGVL